MSTKEVQGWFTANGKHIPIYKGENKQDAYNRSIAIQNEEKKQAELEHNKAVAEALNSPDYVFDEKQLKYLENQQYKEFDGKPTGKSMFGDKEYDEESSQKVGNYMLKNGNADRLIKQIADNEEDFRAFEDWTLGQFMDGQQYGEFSKMSEKDQNLTRIYDKYLDKATLKEGITVVRRSTPQLLGLSKFASDSDIEDTVKDLRGTVIECNGNMSTSCAKTPLKVWQDERTPIEYRIHIPGNTKGAGMWIGDSRINEEWGATQREFMTNRDSVFAVGNCKKNAIDSYIVDLYYIGRQKHRY